MNSEALFSQADEQYELGNFNTAFELFLKAAVQGDLSAMSRVACMYSDGEGTTRDYEKSIEWDLKAAEAGSDTSMLNLAITYRALGDMRSAKKWLEKSLDAGNGEAALCLAKLYMVSDKEADKIQHYLNIAINHDSICKSSKDEADNLLKTYTISP